ncbi:MAG: hypothetical protein H6590_06600 [Flavobacteriales bacterium]|nr:hypothetical protein [Flavobacteriales bacterium]
MENTVLVRNAKGKRVELVAEEEDGLIVLYKKNDVAPMESKRRIVLHSIDEKKLVEFMSAEIQKPEASALKTFIGNLLRKK